MNYNSKSFNHSCQQIVQQFGNAIIAGTNNIPFSIIAIALFGSYALNQNTDDSDIDLLVVADGINPKLHKRAKEIAVLKKILSIGIPLDIMLLTKSECQDNFYNHNPLFLDIAYSGIVIIDTDCFLQSLIDETKEYIVTKKLQKFDDGWRFPVIHRHSTFLSSISNKDFAKAMLADGKRDYEIGCKLIDEKYFDKAIYHFQQSVEKALKAILISFGEFKKTHFVAEILETTINDMPLDDNWKENLIRIAEISKEIEPQVTWSRYPSIVHGSLWIPYENYDSENAIEIRNKANIIISTASDFITQWFID